MNDKYTPEEREAASHLGTTPEDLDLAFAGAALAAEAPTDKIRVLADRFYRWKNERDDAKAVLDNIDRQYAEAEAALFEAIENAGLESVRTPEGLFSLNDLAWPKIDDRDLLLAWAEAEHPDFLTLNLQRLQTPLREALRSGAVLPPGLGYSVTRKIRTTTTRR